MHVLFFTNYLHLYRGVEYDLSHNKIKIPLLLKVDT